MTPEQAPDSLVQRKQLRARQRIIDAADELFALHGYDAVSVSDIAARAEVGRTTFFRYFGDKTEVVFAKEQALLDTIALASADDTVGAAGDCREAVEQLRPIVLRLCAHVVEDLATYERHADLVEKHLELRAREALKTQQLASNLSEVLRSRGTSLTIAVFAAQIALACYETARRRARTAADLVSESSAAFDEVLTLGCG
ncbi:TetR/AcrR family transcriptional regulator [Amycolatopsis sp. NPDC101161]|uniref:TetR/AcrR family transcriptional regulator n=1 Tax=Amycolatopsis sp. NPDC101161 TaxID=3363940 RepID=UPI0037FA6C6E